MEWLANTMLAKPKWSIYAEKTFAEQRNNDSHFGGDWCRF